MKSKQHELPDDPVWQTLYNELYCDACRRFGLKVDCGDHMITYKQAGKYLGLTTTSIAAYSSRIFSGAGRITNRPETVSLSDVVVYGITRQKRKRHSR